VHPHEQYPAHVGEIRAPDYTAAGWAQLILMCSREEADLHALREAESVVVHRREETAQNMGAEASSHRRGETALIGHGVAAEGHRREETALIGHGVTAEGHRREEALIGHGVTAEGHRREEALIGHGVTAEGHRREQALWNKREEAAAGQVQQHMMASSRRQETAGNETEAGPSRGQYSAPNANGQGGNVLNRRQETAESHSGVIGHVRILDAAHDSMMEEAGNRNAHDSVHSNRSKYAHWMQTQNATEAFKAYACPAPATDGHTFAHQFLGTNSGGNSAVDAGSTVVAPENNLAWSHRPTQVPGL
jgi:hypothetical protein